MLNSMKPILSVFVIFRKRLAPFASDVYRIQSFTLRFHVLRSVSYWVLRKIPGSYLCNYEPLLKLTQRELAYGTLKLELRWNASMRHFF